MKRINIAEYDYDLPEARIAQYPLGERDASRLLVFDGKNITSDIFRNLGNHLPADSLLVFNNTRVISARLLFKKKSGAGIEILCLEPLDPASYEKSFSSTGPVEWKCMIGNLKKWKTGCLKLEFTFNDRNNELTAERLCPEGEAWRIRFSWNDTLLSFSEVIDASGHTPLPPYISREDEKEDSVRYQTVYSRIKGSVAAPTAGLHFTENLLKKLSEDGAKRSEITLHVGAGTFQPVRTMDVAEHEMHCEHFFVTNDTIDYLIENYGSIIAVGTTSARTIESLYWLGIKTAMLSPTEIWKPEVDQWEPYHLNTDITGKDSLTALKIHMERYKIKVIEASTRIIIVPGYRFKIVNGIVTNFHQPRSTLLLLIAAWAGGDWKKIYRYALDNGFRFLSYGDSSLLIR